MNPDEVDAQIMEILRVAYGNNLGELRKDLHFLNEYRMTMTKIEGRFLMGTVTLFVAGIAAALWAGFKVLVMKQ